MSIKKVKEMVENGKSVEEILEEVDLKENVVYRVVGNEKEEKGNSLSEMNKSDMVRIIWLFSDYNKRKIFKKLKVNYSWGWRIVDKLKDNEDKMEKIYNKYNEMVEEKGLKKLFNEFSEECKRRKEKKKDNK